MAKLHEILAVEGDLEGIAKKLLGETVHNFGKPELFTGKTKILEMFDASAPVTAPEYKEMTTTVPKKLDYLSEALIRHFDAVLQKEATNQLAKADLVVDGESLAENIPATFLLGLESKLKILRQVYESAPTLRAGVAWEKDLNAGDDVYRARHPEEKFKTAKTFRHQVLVPPTDKHPAQIEKWEEQVPVGKYIETETTGMISSAEKSDYLKRIDKLIQAVKKARMRANMQSVEEVSIGDKLFRYINGK